MSSPGASFAIGGTITGVTGTVVLQNNGGDDLSLASNGSFAFTTTVADGRAYDVTVKSQPAGSSCLISNGAGNVSGSAVSAIIVACASNVQTLLLSEVATLPSAGEFIAILNVTSAPVALDNYYLADVNSYYLITQGAPTIASSDFIARFPSGAMVAAGGFVVVSLDSATNFFNTYGFYPDFDLDPADSNAPSMLGQFTSSSGLTDTAEMVVLFSWDGASALVKDVDYFVWGDTTSGVTKSGVTIGSATYANDTPLATQIAMPSSTTGGETYKRIDLMESTESSAGGNGITGHDETSEDLSFAWIVSPSPTPGRF